MVILLSPSKTISEEAMKISSKLSRPIFLDEAEWLMKKLKKMSANDLGKLMNINPTLAEKTAGWFTDWSPIPLEEKARIAAHCFKGSVYTGLNARNWSDSDFVFAQQHLRIVSGLYGLLKPLDRIQPYRLEMGLKWQMEPRYSNLYKYWGKRISDKIELESDGLILNLASKEYSKAAISKEFKGKMITPEFKEKVGEEYKVKMTYAKEARGSMANFIIKNRITNPIEIKKFQGLGYTYNTELSDETHWIFTR